VRAPGRAETTFLGAENIVDPESIRRCAAFLDAEPAGNVLVVGGSIPAWPEPKWEPLRRAIERWIGCGLIAVDTYGEPLRWFAGRAVDLVKINRREFAGLLGRDPASPIDDAAMPALLDDAARTHRALRWVVTDGPGRVWHRDREGLAGSRMPPRVDEVSPTGSGDVLLAALVWGMAARRMDLAAALETALPIAAANAAHPGVADFDLAPFASIFGGLP
jgi:fructose-1-phosphate kinase PfkB-like protein